MSKHILFVVFIVLGVEGYSQKKVVNKVNAIGVSVPIIWNNSNGIFYSLGNRIEPSGKALSYGISVNYYRTIYKNWFASVGVGYFNQSFNISRKFDFDGDPATNLLYNTKKYNYHCALFTMGLGYHFIANDKFKLSANAAYNLLNSFEQQYTPTSYSGAELKKTQTNNNNFNIGSMVNVSVGFDYAVSKRISIGADVVFPIITKWNNDEIFFGSLWSYDSQQIAENKFSIGTVLNCKYHF